MSAAGRWLGHVRWFSPNMVDWPHRFAYSFASSWASVWRNVASSAAARSELSLSSRTSARRLAVSSLFARRRRDDIYEDMSIDRARKSHRTQNTCVGGGSLAAELVEMEIVGKTS